jgi:hypothetical protein
MVTEGRVRALEDELKVVKNEIQATLLDIQKEILAHYYSSGQTSGRTDIDSDQRQNDGNESSQSMAGTSMRSGPPPNGPAPAAEPETVSRPPRPEAETSTLGIKRGRELLRDPATWSAVAKLLIWVNESVAEIGRDRTARAIRMYGLHDYISAEMQKTLLALVTFCHEERPPSQVNLRRLLETLAKFHAILEERNQRVDLYHILSLIGEILP